MHVVAGRGGAFWAPYGVTAIRQLREAHPHICLIALTGDESTDMHEQATQAGADGVLVKGQMLEALVERLRGARA